VNLRFEDVEEHRLEERALEMAALGSARDDVIGRKTDRVYIGGFEAAMDARVGHHVRYISCSTLHVFPPSLEIPPFQ